MRKLLILLLFVASFASVGIFADDVQVSLEEAIPLAQKGKRPIATLSIDSDKGIDKSTWVYVKTALDYFKEKNALFVILNINSPGGEVISCQKIGDALRSLDLQDGIPVIAVLHQRALSGGAMIAYNCRYIYAHEDSIMGAATPVYASQQTGMEKAPEKMVSVIRAEFANSAKLFGRSAAIAQAMVDESLIVVWRKGKAKILKETADIRSSDIVISPEGMLLTMDADELSKYQVVDEVINYKEGVKDSLFEVGYFEQFKGEPLLEVPFDWKVEILALLSSPLVSSLLLLGLLIGFYMEFQTPGFGIPGAIGILCLGLMSITAFSLDVIHWVDYGLLVLGFILIMIELFVIPGFGIIGILGMLIFFVGAALLFLPSLEWLPNYLETGELNLVAQGFLDRLIWLLGTFVIFAILLVIITRYLQNKTRALSHLVLHDEQSKSQGYEASGGILHGYISSEGITATNLRPAGKVSIKGRLLDAQSNGTYIEKDCTVRVVEIRGQTLIVERKGED